MNTIDDSEKQHDQCTFNGVEGAKKIWQGVVFDGCCFEQCDFSAAQFRECEFIDCQFIACDLSGAVFGMSRFQEVEFSACQLFNVDWTLVDWSGFVLAAPFSFSDCDLQLASFNGLELKSLRLLNCQAREVDFREADLTDANFEGSDLSHALFVHCDLSSVNFVESTGAYIDLKNNKIEGARFERIEAVNLLASLGIELVD